MGPHSYDPGVSENDVMWTTEIPESSVDFDFHEEEASLHVKNVLVFDAFTVPNSLDTHHPMGKVHAVINSLRIEWRGTTFRRPADSLKPGNRYKNVRRSIQRRHFLWSKR